MATFYIPNYQTEVGGQLVHDIIVGKTPWYSWLWLYSHQYQLCNINFPVILTQNHHDKRIVIPGCKRSCDIVHITVKASNTNIVGVIDIHVTKWKQMWLQCEEYMKYDLLWLTAYAYYIETCVQVALSDKQISGVIYIHLVLDISSFLNTKNFLDIWGNLK